MECRPQRARCNQVVGGRSSRFSPRATECTQDGLCAPFPSSAGEGGRAKPAGWGMARCYDAKRLARTLPQTSGPSALLSTPHPSPSATPPVFARAALPAPRRRGARQIADRVVVHGQWRRIVEINAPGAVLRPSRSIRRTKLFPEPDFAVTRRSTCGCARRTRHCERKRSNPAFPPGPAVDAFAPGRNDGVQMRSLQANRCAPAGAHDCAVRSLRDGWIASLRSQ